MVAPIMLITDEVADLVGIEPTSWRTYVSRGDAPRPDDYVGATPLWRKSTIEKWMRERPGQGIGGGRPRKDGSRAEPK